VRGVEDKAGRRLKRERERENQRQQLPSMAAMVKEKRFWFASALVAWGSTLPVDLVEKLGCCNKPYPFDLPVVG
jgi:hypothetical protein